MDLHRSSLHRWKIIWNFGCVSGRVTKRDFKFDTESVFEEQGVIDSSFYKYVVREVFALDFAVDAVGQFVSLSLSHFYATCDFFPPKSVQCSLLKLMMSIMINVCNDGDKFYS